MIYLELSRPLFCLLLLRRDKAGIILLRSLVFLLALHVDPITAGQIQWRPVHTYTRVYARKKSVLRDFARFFKIMDSE